MVDYHTQSKYMYSYCYSLISHCLQIQVFQRTPPNSRKVKSNETIIAIYFVLGYCVHKHSRNISDH